MFTETKMLLDIQNLEMALRENEVIHKGTTDLAFVSTIKGKIEDIKSQLSFDTRSMYERIAQRYEIFVSPMMNNSCTGCFMKLPLADSNNVKTGLRLATCPHCDRFLYFEEQTGKVADHYKCQGIARFSSPNLMFPEIKARSKNVAIKKMVDLMSKAGFIKNKKEFAEKLIERENLFSTGVGGGLAFPHTRGVFAQALTFAVARLPEGVDFSKKQKVHLMIVFAIPIQVNMFYLEVVSTLAAHFEKPGNLDKFLACPNAEAMWDSLLQICR